MQTCRGASSITKNPSSQETWFGVNSTRLTYVVRDRDTLGEIAEWYHTSARRLRAWNNLSYRSYIYPGQKLTIYVPQSFDLAKLPSSVNTKPNESDHVRKNYTVKKGDTIYSISRHFNVAMSDLLAWNGKTSRSKIFPGDKLEVWQKKN